MYLSVYLSLHLRTGTLRCQEALDSLAGPSLHPQPCGARHITAHLTEQSILPQYQTVLQPLTDCLIQSQCVMHLYLPIRGLTQCRDQWIRSTITMQDTDLCNQSDGNLSGLTNPSLHVLTNQLLPRGHMTCQAAGHVM